MRKCYFCGSDVPDNAQFCPKCGKTIEITQDLIDRAKSNDSNAQTELYERTYKTVYSRIRAKVSDNDTVMDIMQETYLRAFTNLGQLQKAETFPSWLLTIANRQVCNWYQKNGKEQQNVLMSQLAYENDDTISNEDDLLEEPEYREDFSPDESLDRAETGRLLSEILDTLPEDQRIILTMRYYDEMSLNEISEGLGVNLSTVKTRLTAGKKKVEAKVLELEKNGTKLYSLGPVAFLVFLLHHMELFAPVISANTIIGLTAVGAGTAAGGTAVGAAAQATAGVTGKAAAGAAVKAAGGAAVKGIGVRIAAVAAAVVVAGGITTAVIVSNNDHMEPDPTPSLEESVSEEAVVMTVDPPSDDTVMEMAEDLNKWIANSDLGTDSINLDQNMACQLAAVMISECGYAGDDGVTRAGTGDYDGYKSVISEEALDQCLHDLFGSGYQASDFKNTETTDLIQSVYPGYSTDLSGYLIRDENGDLVWYYTGIGEDETFAEANPVEVTDISSIDQDDGTCTATVRYDWYTYIDTDNTGNSEGTMIMGSSDVVLHLKHDEESKYNWVISSIQEGPFGENEAYAEYIENLQKKNIKSISVTSEQGSALIEYDSDGNILSENFDFVDSNFFWNKHLYDNDDNFWMYYQGEYTLPFAYDFEGNNLLCKRDVYTYDDDNNMLSQTEYDMYGNLYSQSEMTYDSNGNMQTNNQASYGGIEEAHYWHDYTYDINGNLTNDDQYTIRESFVTSSVYTYDGEGNRLTWDYYANAAPIFFEYTYDSEGNRTTKKREESGGYILYEYTYDDNGKLLTEMQYAGGDTGQRLVCWTEYTYDNDGNMLTATFYDPEGDIISTDEFTFDSAGNVLTESGHNRGGSSWQYKYTYEYY